VLLLHGFPQHWYAWRGLLADLAGEYRVVAVDLPGFGWSGPSPRGYSTAERGRQLIALLDELGLDRVDLVGHDWGAWLAFHVGLCWPTRVRRLVAISEIHPWPLQRRLVPRLWRMWVTAIFEIPLLGRVLGARARVISWFLTRDARDPSIWTEQLLAAYTAVAARREVAVAGQRMHAAFVARDVVRLVLRLNWRAQYDIPTLMVGGDNDSYIPPALMDAPGSRAAVLPVVTVPGGHFLLDENPVAVSRAVRSHLADEVPI
jgi:pimeloyl-ACP methyl ester carboxylesterase